MSTKLRYLYRAWRYRYRVDPAEIRFVCESLQPGQVAVDIGCHKGAYTYWMQRQVGNGGSVFAFEPQPGQVAYLRQAFDALSFDNVTLVPMALTDSIGTATLQIPNGAGRTHGASLERGATGVQMASLLPVEVTTLDAFFENQPRGPDFLKVDVEGHELAVLRGARETLAAYRPKLLIECEARHRPDGDVRAVFFFLHSLGYRGTFFQRRRRWPLSEFHPAEHQPQAVASGKLPPGYVNNFAFE